MRSAVRSIFVVRTDQVRKLDRIAERTGKTRSAVVRDAIDRLLSPPTPDAVSRDGVIPPKS